MCIRKRFVASIPVIPLTPLDIASLFQGPHAQDPHEFAKKEVIVSRAPMFCLLAESSHQRIVLIPCILHTGTIFTKSTNAVKTFANTMIISMGC